MLRFSVRTKLFLTFFLFGLTLTAFALFIATNISKNSVFKIALDNAKVQFLQSRNIFRFYIDNAEAKLVAIQNSTIFHRYIRSKRHTNSDVEDLFLSIAKSDNFIMQLRYIDTSGKEVLRVDRNVCYALPYLVTQEQLQNKARRYYFKEILATPKDHFWVSNLDLNVERGQIERPIKPVLRIGTPVFRDNEKVGILVLNVFMKKLLDSLRSSKLYNLYIIDKDGYFILHPNPKYNWSRYLGKPVTVKDFFKEYDQILAKNEYESKKFYSASINFQNPDGMKMIIEPTREFIRSSQKDLYANLVFILIGLILVTVPISYKLAAPYIRVQNNLDELNRHLENEVEQKTKELKDLNANLEQKIQERTNEQNILLSLFDLGDSVLFKWRNDEHWSVEYVSKSVEKLLGYTPYEFINGDVKYSECIHPEDLRRVVEEVTEAMEKKLYFFTHKPYRVLTKNSQTKWIHDSTVIVRDHDQKVVNFVGYLIDITDLQESRLKLQELSTTDTLTQAYNRLFLDEILHKQYYRLLRNDERCSIILMDIDYFKSVNDRFGHLAGDQVLTELAKIVQENIRESDTFGRWGGEEFMIVSPHTSIQEAIALAEKLRKIIESHNFASLEGNRLTVSFGVTECTKEKTLDTNILAADQALYRSKENGRNTVSSA